MEKKHIEVTKFLDKLTHPLRKEIEELREIILNSKNGLTEDKKWNGPNYSIDGQDRITMRIHPINKVQLIFHRGARKQEQPKERIIKSGSKLLLWKENDRAIVSFKSIVEIENGAEDLRAIIKEWILKTK